MRTFVYIDALNLYHGCLEGTPYRWLDCKSLLEALLATTHGDRKQIVKIKYFTSLIEADFGKRRDEEDYISALESHIPEFEAIYGKFVDGKEKQTDVNIAVHMVHDAWLYDYDCVVLVSNDSDLKSPMQFIRQDRHIKRVPILITPAYNRDKKTGNEREVAWDLRRFVREHNARKLGPDFVTDNKGVAVLSKSSAELLSDSQLPDVVLGSGGRDILKPRSW